MKQRTKATLFVFMLAGLLYVSTSFAQEAATLKVTVNSDMLAITTLAAARYEASNPHTINGKAYTVTVDLLEAPADPRVRKQSFAVALETGKNVSDVYGLEVVLAGELAIYLANLYDYEGLAAAASQHFPVTIAAAQFAGGLVAMPWTMNAGLLYYRQDLLEAYGFTAPPATWDELAVMAQTIQTGERSQTPAFYGYIWQGGLHNPLMANALEWFASNGAGTLLNTEQEITVNNPAALQSLLRAQDWLATISPTEVLSYDEGSSFALWQAGLSAFMRNRYDYDVTLDPSTRIAPLPAGSSGQASTLASQHLAVAKTSTQPDLAADFVRFLTSPEEQKLNALAHHLLPTRPALYRDIDVTLAIPYLGALEQGFSSAVARPAVAAGTEYERASRLFARAVHNVLQGEASPQQALEFLELDLQDLTGFASH